jgi:hypothetical protein
VPARLDPFCSKWRLLSKSKMCKLELASNRPIQLGGRGLLFVVLVWLLRDQHRSKIRISGILGSL